MRHRVKGKKLGRKTAHRRQTLRDLSNALIREHRIVTTLAKAKALRPFFEPLVTRAKEDTQHNRRQVFSTLNNKETVTKLFDEIGPKAQDRPGGYTRIIRYGYRQGDGAEMAIIELVDYNDIKPEQEQKKKKKTRRAGRKKKTTSAQPQEDTQSSKEEDTATTEASEQESSEAGEEQAESDQASDVEAETEKADTKEEKKAENAQKESDASDADAVEADAEEDTEADAEAEEEQETKAPDEEAEEEENEEKKDNK